MFETFLKVVFESNKELSKGDDTQGNFLSNVAGQCRRTMMLGHFPIENGQQISIWIHYINIFFTYSISATLPDNIAQKVAPYIITLRNEKLHNPSIRS
ncbi:MAG: hypothetical protein ACRCZO_13855 [Cetobacterium sp.]